MLKRLPSAAAQTAQEVDAALNAVFERPEFSPPPPSPLRDLIARGMEALGDFLRGLLPGFDLGPGGRAVVFWIVVASIATAAAYVAFRLQRRHGARSPGLRVSRKGAVRDTAPAPATADEWERRAAGLANDGRWREAALALYQLLLHHLADRGVLRLDAAKTAGDYRRESRGNPDAQRLLDRFLQRFEPVAFGGIPGDGTAYAHLLELTSLAKRLG